MEGCDCMGICSDIQKLNKSIESGSVDKDIADQHENLCTNGPAVNSGALPCGLRDSYKSNTN